MKKLTVAFLAIALTAIGSVFVFGQTSGNDKARFEGPGKRGPGHHGRFGNRGRGMNEMRFFRQLDLTDDQKAQLKAIRDTAREEAKTAREAQKENHKKLAELGTDGNFDQAAVETLATQQAELHKQMIIQRQKVKAQMFAVLTPEQKAKAAELRQNFGERMKQRLENFKKRFGQQKADQ